MDKQYHSEDITFCTSKKCTITKCMRNQKNIRNHFIPHSFADLDGKKGYCFKAEAKLKGQHNEKLF